MVLTVMNPAQRYRELVAHLEPHRPRLGESEMVGVSGASSADQAWQRGHEFEVGLVAQSTWLTERQLALIDLGGGCVGLLMLWSRRAVIDERGSEGWPDQ